MILIQTSSDDFSSSSVIQWLCNYNKSFIRINNKSIIDNITFSEKSLQIKIYNKDININEIKKYWFRRGSFDFQIKLNDNFSEIDIPYKNYITGEHAVILKLLNDHFLYNIKSIGNYQTSKVNKIIACKIAKNSGFIVPDFIITTKKKELIKFYKKKSKIISKSLYGLPGFAAKNIDYSAKTKVIEMKDIDNSTEEFAVSLFQEYIEKKIEIRTFFINDKFYSSAIFSQSDAKTQIDFRNYNREKPNRVIPFQLPESEIKKLKRINKKLSLNTGSYDLILTPENQYVFLEVNPIGQFAQVSLPCNYYIEKQIAKILGNG